MLSIDGRISSKKKKINESNTNFIIINRKTIKWVHLKLTISEVYLKKISPWKTSTASDSFFLNY